MDTAKHLDLDVDLPAKRPIRILYIIDSLSSLGGAELSLLRLIRHLPPERFQCHVVTFHSNKFAQSFIDKFPCPVEHWNLDNIYDRSALRVAMRLSRFVQREQIDVVHTFFQTSDLWAGPIVKMSGVKVLISSRRDMGILRNGKHKFGYRMLRNIFDQIQTVSEGVRSYTIQTDGVDPDRTVTVYNGIDSDFGRPEEDEVEQVLKSLDLRPGTPVVICVANWRWVKGIDVLIRAAALVGKEMPEVQFLIAGRYGNAEPEFTEATQELNRALGGEQRMRFLGPSDQVPHLLNLSHVFVLPSRSEGFSNALLEGMAAGLPCVATAVGGNPEVVIDGVTGFLIPTDDHTSLADRILTLLRDPDTRRRMGNAGRQRILQDFTSSAMASQVTVEYERLLRFKTDRQQPSLTRASRLLLRIFQNSKLLLAGCIALLLAAGAVILSTS